MSDEVQRYTDEEIATAQAEMGELTPESYLDLVHEVTRLREQNFLPEAGGIAFTELYGANGGKINITSRASTAFDAAVELMNSVGRLMERYASLGLTPVRKGSQTTAPAYQTTSAPAAQVTQPAGAQEESPMGGQVIAVRSIARRVSSNTGTPYLNIKSDPPLHKFGVAAWPETFPPGFNVESLAFNTDVFDIPESMRYAVLNAEGKKVARFQSNP